MVSSRKRPVDDPILELCSNFEGCPLLGTCIRGSVSKRLFEKEQGGRWVPYRWFRVDIGQAAIEFPVGSFSVPATSTLYTFECEGHFSECTE